tara:strand:- start:436 stop:930 length:495 start_codon:yes stop_codon:yes gene_type:complete
LSSTLANIFLFAVVFYNHAHYVSITNAKLNEKSNKLEISVELTAHDIEAYFLIHNKVDLKLGSSKEFKQSNELLSSYISKNLLFKINGKSLTLSFLGKQVNNDETLLLFFESKLPKNILEVSISNSILTKTFSDQQNIVHLTGIVKESFTFNENLTTKSYYLNN